MCLNEISLRFAVITGAMTDYVGLNEKLECGHKFKHHVEEALRLNPRDSLAFHLLGRWCIEVAGLSWFEKKACSAIFGEPPEATYDDALKNLLQVCYIDFMSLALTILPLTTKHNFLLQADTLYPDWALNTLFLGKVRLF